MERLKAFPFLLFGILSFCLGLTLYFVGVSLFIPRYLLGLNHTLLPISEFLVWYSGVPIVFGIAVSLIDLLVLMPSKRRQVPLKNDPVDVRGLTVALTAYDDEDSIIDAVNDFKAHPLVERVIVVSNNSKDATFERAEQAGALTFNEMSPGYGQCVYRCYKEALKYEDAQIIILCEGDRTFRAQDIDKLLAYAPHGDIVNGTRTVEPLREYSTQLSTFMYYGNLFVGKLLEAKHLGRSTLTDVGTTYKLCRREALADLMAILDPRVNLEFNAYFLDIALATNKVLLECPVTFYKRVGVSKGGNINNLRGLKVGLRMIAGMVFGWKAMAT